MRRVRLARKLATEAVFVSGAPVGNRTGWHLLLLRVPRPALDWVATLRLGWPGADAASQEIVLARSFGLGLFGIKLGVFFLREDVSGITARLYNVHTPPDAVGLALLRVPQFLAAIGVFGQSPAVFRGAFRAVAGSLPTRLRKALSAAAGSGQQMPDSYAHWLRFFDTWREERLDAMMAALPAMPPVGALVFHAGGNEAPLAATLASLRAQRYPVARTVVAGPGAAVPVQELGEGFVAVLQAGEVLPRQALLLLVRELGRSNGAELLLGDEDSVGPDGVRADPWFKPQPNLTMMCSGLLSRGVWLIRASLLQPDQVPRWAECVRLQAWFALRAANRADLACRVPYLLTQRRHDTEAAPPSVLAQVVDANLQRLGVQADALPEFPLRLRWHGKNSPKVSLLVPSRLRGNTQLSCMLDILEKTTYRDFEMLVVVTQDAELDQAQNQAAQRLRAAGPARVEVLRRKGFNYSAANNHAASLTRGELVCLLNDDVSTLEGSWLDRMVAVFSDPATGIVGAKLYYPNMTTQHGGVVMGLGGLAQHANQFLPRGQPGYMWRGVLDQEMSAVTGACLLVRRRLFEEVGGLDEDLPTAFNDVDFCLRVRALGYSVIMAASVELLHHETLSFGHHYAGNTAGEATDVRLMQRRWPAVCAADPFHNPNLSLAGQSEWKLAYPPRVGADTG